MYSSDSYDNPASHEKFRLRHPQPRRDPFTDPLLQRGSEHLHRLGPRAMAELLTEVDRRIGGMPCILGLLTEYEQRMTPQMLRLTGGDRFPTRRLRAVPR
jgi:hypothetical protein